MLAFLPSFAAGDFQSAEDEYMKTGQNPPIVHELITEVYRSGFVYPFDWSAWDATAVLKALDSSDVLTLRKLMTAFVRSDRFCGGHMPTLCSNGTIERVLRRLNDVGSHTDV